MTKRKSKIRQREEEEMERSETMEGGEGTKERNIEEKQWMGKGGRGGTKERNIEHRDNGWGKRGEATNRGM